VKEQRNARKLIGLSLFFRLSVLVLGAMCGSLMIGVWLDRVLCISPIGTLCMMMLGISSGTIAVYRTVNETNAQIALSSDEDYSRGDS
jgi:F0F1-type ATP synthase assembly protein I